MIRYFSSNVRTSARFAVRSSAVGEDSEDLSSAGQNDTFLGCKSLDSIFKAVIKCWASLYSHQSVEYRRQNGQAISGIHSSFVISVRQK